MARIEPLASASSLAPRELAPVAAEPAPPGRHGEGATPAPAQTQEAPPPKRCAHESLWFDTCAHCLEQIPTARVQEEYVSLGSGLHVLRGRAGKLSSEATQALLRGRKLALVLDLDETLVHTTAYRDVPAEGLPPGPAFRLTPGEFTYVVAQRPFLERFLREMSALFELHLYTMGNEPYAKKVCEIIDKDGVFFKRRIISKDDSPTMGMKDLFRRQQGIHEDEAANLFHVKQIVPIMGDESMIVVVDNRNDVWENSPNLIQIEDYVALPSAPPPPPKEGEAPAPPADTDVGLVHMGEKLKRVHKEFFKQYDNGRKPDVRNIIRTCVATTLEGVRLAFSGLIPVSSVTQNDPLWKLSLKLGATPMMSVNEHTTHLVAKYLGTDKTSLAQKLGTVYVVSVNWLHEALRSWTRPPEEAFLLTDPSGKAKRPREGEEEKKAPTPPPLRKQLLQQKPEDPPIEDLSNLVDECTRDLLS